MFQDRKSYQVEVLTVAALAMVSNLEVNLIKSSVRLAEHSPYEKIENAIPVYLTDTSTVAFDAAHYFPDKTS